MNPAERHLAGFAQVLDQIASASRRIVETPAEYPKKPNLIDELEACASALDVAAKLTEIGYPTESMLFSTRARQVRAKIAIARFA